HRVILGWGLYMFLVSASRFVLSSQYQRVSADPAGIRKWSTAFAVGAGLSGAGWGAAGVFLYPEGSLANQGFLIFVLGRMMLGAASLHASRPETFLAFLIPTGLAPAVRLLLQGDRTHVAMGLLAAVFTLATLMTTWRIYCTIASSLWLKFENRDLVDDLQAAK